MKSVSSTWITSLTAEELAKFFQVTSEGIFSTPWRRFASHVPSRFSAGKMKFFTPRDAADDPFSQYKAKPIFLVGVQGPQGGMFGWALPVAIHMYVYENGSTSKVVFAAPYGARTTSKGKARDHVRRFATALSMRDGRASEERSE
jgi:hypothetical protein